MIYELLQPIVSNAYAATPQADNAAVDDSAAGGTDTTSEQASTDTGTESEIIEIQPDKLYRLAGSEVEPSTGKDMVDKHMLHRGFTQKTQEYNNNMKLLNDLVTQQKQQIEQLNNQMLKVKLGQEFQQQQPQVNGQGEPAPQPPQQQPAPQDTGYDWFSESTTPTDQTNQPQQGINSTPALDINTVASALLQHPDFAGQLERMVDQKAEEKITVREQQLQQDKQFTEAALQIENDMKNKWGDAAVDLWWKEIAAIKENEVDNVLGTLDEFAEVAGKRYHEMIEKKRKEEEKAAIEEAVAAPIEVEAPKEGESKGAYAQRKKQEVINNYRRLSKARRS